MEHERPTKIVIDGREYESAAEMPPEIREVYERTMALLADRDANGVPDLFEGKGRGLVATLREAWGIGQAAKKAGIRSFEMPRGGLRAGARPDVAPAIPPRPASTPPRSAAVVEASPIGGRLGGWIVFACFAAAAWLVARELGFL